MTVAILPLLSPPSCWDYLGGCEPSTLDTVLRGIIGLFGYGPEITEALAFLVGVVVLTAYQVLSRPLPSSGRAIAKRLGYSLGLVGVFGHGTNLLATYVPLREVVYIIDIAVVVGVVLALVAIGVLRTRQLVANLRGDQA